MTQDMDSLSQPASKVEKTTVINRVVGVSADPLGKVTEPEWVAQKIESIFDHAKNEHFKDGMASEFSRNLTSIVQKYGDVAVKAIAEQTFSEEIDSEIRGEALRQLGSIDHPQTQSSRLALLEQSLDSPVVELRDGAIVGIAFLDDPCALFSLRQAIQRETHVGLRSDIQQVIDQLEETLASDTQDVAK